MADLDDENLGNHGPKARDWAYADRVAYCERLISKLTGQCWERSDLEGWWLRDPDAAIRAVLTAMRTPPIPMSAVGAEEWTMAIEELLK
jgi:hypothetical protein